MKFTYYGHSCFAVEINGIHLLFDPFISGNDEAKNISIAGISADYILLSHGHQDHIMDCEAIALRTGATVICAWEIYEWLLTKGISNIHPMNIGGKKTFGNFSVKCVVAHHSSVLPDGAYGGNPMGFIVSANDESFYYSGDTALTLDMKLVPRWANLTFAVLPIGDNFTMGMNDAIIAAEFVQVKKVIGVHYNTFPYIEIDLQLAVKQFDAAGLELILLQPGQAINI